MTPQNPSNQPMNLGHKNALFASCSQLERLQESIPRTGGVTGQFFRGRLIGQPQRVVFLNRPVAALTFKSVKQLARVGRRVLFSNELAHTPTELEQLGQSQPRSSV